MTQESVSYCGFTAIGKPIVKLQTLWEGGMAEG